MEEMTKDRSVEAIYHWGEGTLEIKIQGSSIGPQTVKNVSEIPERVRLAWVRRYLGPNIRIWRSGSRAELKCSVMTEDWGDETDLLDQFEESGITKYEKQRDPPVVCKCACVHY